MYDSSSNDYRLSGIGHRIHSQKYVRALNEQATAIIGCPTKVMRDLTTIDCELVRWWHNYEAPKRDWRTLVVAIHMRCWNLVQRVLGPVVEKNLELFTGLSLQKARELEYGEDGSWEETNVTTGNQFLVYEAFNADETH